MKYLLRIVPLVLISMFFLVIVSVGGQEKQHKKAWTGKLADGTVIHEEDMSSILAEHKRWLESSGRDGRRANLSKAILWHANLRGANLEKANLSGVKLTKASLSQANLTEADLREAFLMRTDLREANFHKAKMSKVKLMHANLSEADLRGADLSKADLWDANLSTANLGNTNLSEATLVQASLKGASLKQTNLTGALLTEVDITNATYEPATAPMKGFLIGIRGLKDVRFSNGKQSGLVLLRIALKEAGLRELEREATYSIEHGNTIYAPWPEKYFKLLLFEWTCGYGLYYGRPLIILSLLIVVFTFPYMIALRTTGADGVWRVWIPDRVRKDKGTENPERLLLRGFAALRTGLYFSLLSAFSIGWRELNVGSWIARIQRGEYILRATGWTRSVSGIQSLLSVYLLALWALTYFGRPFG